MDRARGDLRVERGRLELAVPEQDLDDADVDVLLEQVGGKAMPQRVRADALADPGRFGSLMNGTVELPRRDRIGVAAPGEQPTSGAFPTALRAAGTFGSSAVR